VIPLQFGVGARLLLGVYTPAAEPRKRRGVVICNPWGGEALRAHRTLRLLADLLAQDGHDVLRFDYSGTGDSFGASEGAQLMDWVEDTECAIDEILSVAGATRVSVVGLRLGSWVAAAAAARRPDSVDRVVMWEPVYEGRAHVTDLLAHDQIGSSRDGTAHVDGFPLTPRFRADLEGSSLPSLSGRSFRALMVHSGVNDSARGAPTAQDVTVMRSDASPCWVEEREFGVGAVPVELLRKVKGWLG